MRLDAHKGDTNWCVYHAEECCRLKAVVWIDDETCEWCQYELPYRAVGDELSSAIHRARKITIIPARRLIIINPIEDSETNQITEAIAEETVV